LHEQNSVNIASVGILDDLLQNVLVSLRSCRPQINDPFIYGTCSLGLLFGSIQFALYLVFPRSKKAEAGDQRFSIVSMMTSSVGFRISVRNDTEQTAVETSSNDYEEGGSDLEMDHDKNETTTASVDFRRVSFSF
jgi:hypothetical protein